MASKFITAADKSQLADYKKMFDMQGIAYKVSMNPGGGYRIRLIGQKEAVELEAEKKVRTIEAKHLAEQQAGEAMIAVQDKKTAKRLAEILDKKGIKPEINTAYKTPYVFGYSKLTGEPVRWTKEEIDDLNEELAKQQQMKPGFVKQVYRKGFTPKRMMERTSEFGKEMYKDEVAKTMKVTSEHADVIGAMKKSIPGIKGKHARITGIDEYGNARRPMITAEPRIKQSREFSVDRRMIHNPNRMKEKTATEILLDQENNENDAI